MSTKKKTPHLPRGTFRKSWDVRHKSARDYNRQDVNEELRQLAQETLEKESQRFPDERFRDMVEEITQDDKKADDVE